MKLYRFLVKFQAYYGAFAIIFLLCLMLYSVAIGNGPVFLLNYACFTYILYDLMEGWPKYQKLCMLDIMEKYYYDPDNT